MKIETVHVAGEPDEQAKNPMLLCGKRYNDYGSRTNAWDTIEKLIEEPLLELDYIKEVLCEECKNHPDFILGYLAYI